MTINPYDPDEPFTPVVAQDPWLNQDADGDGLSNQTEIILGTNPYSGDTDWDGVSDSQELARGTEPLQPDTDRDGICDGADLCLGNNPNQASPEVVNASDYQRLAQTIDHTLPPFLQDKQVAQAALNEAFTTPEVQDILSHSPRFQEIAASLGWEKATQFADTAIAAAERQTAIESQPQPAIQPEAQNHSQLKLGR